MNRILIIASVIVGLFIIGCSDDDVPVSKDSAVVEEQGTKEQGTKEQGTKEQGTATGACTNATDMKLLDSAAKQTAIKGKATTCGLGCTTDPDPKKCASACVVKATGLSTGCSACYAGIIKCTIDNCLTDCASDPNSKACTDCMTTNKCYTAFYTCSGLTPPATSDAGL